MVNTTFSKRRVGTKEEHMQNVTTRRKARYKISLLDEESIQKSSNKLSALNSVHGQPTRHVYLHFVK